MRTFTATVLVAAACFLVFSATTVKAGCAGKPNINPTTVKPTTMKPTDATTLNPSTVTTRNPETTTFKPASVSTLMPTSTTTLAPTPGTNYCNINTCSVPTDNTLCKYTNTTWGSACQPAYPAKSNISAADIVTILSVHNDYRRKVAQGLETQGSPGPQPPASNMRELKWDQELAVMAAAHAQQCVFQHDSCRNVPRFQVGQNIYISSSSDNNLGTSDWNAAVTEWYNEVKDMNTTYAASFPRSPPNVIGHYTQVVWADTYLVGCAVAYYQSTAEFGPDFSYNRFYVCNYGPTGNWLGSAVYKQGTAGSACPTGTANNDGLCA
ncbi:venom allergen 3 homolog [Daphnia pulex]|uniref:venom allergen 3 homolog n=1 Tax=Daphnia pulex TaxID=6669 RepID=UPI001EDF8A66|nr:venom allergen 3 homolog [Daphnia pulex]XP_046458401.1 venom allergen 3 homolog [Daphnia pulex]